MTPRRCCGCSATPTRLRLLRVLSRESLNVSELTAVLGVAQSGRVAASGPAAGCRPGRRGTRRRLHVVPARARQRSPNDDGPRRRSGAGSRDEFERTTPETRADDARLEEVRRLRKENFSRHGGGDERRQLVPGRSWAAWARALGLAAAAARRRRPRLRRGLSDDRSGALGASRRSPSIGRTTCSTRAGAGRRGAS